MSKNFNMHADRGSAADEYCTAGVNNNRCSRKARFKQPKLMSMPALSHTLLFIRDCSLKPDSLETEAEGDEYAGDKWA